MNKHLILSAIVVLLICVGLSGCVQNNDLESTGTDSDSNEKGDIDETEEQFVRIGDTIPEIGTDYDKHNLSMTLISIEESDICVNGPYIDGYYTFTAQEGMKFITLTYDLQNHWIREQITPSMGYGEILTDREYYYNYWNPPIGIHSEEYQPRKSTEEEVEKFIGQEGSLKELLPEETTLGCAVFEIPEEQSGLEITLSNVPYTIDIESEID